MRGIGIPIPTFQGDDTSISLSENQVGAAPGAVLSSYRQLLVRVASLSWEYRGYQLLFRGQSEDFKIDNLSGLHPSIFRPDSRMETQRLIDRRFEILDEACRSLIEEINADSTDTSTAELARLISTDQLLQWAVLQHYGVCPTPLLDLSPSLLVALGFALTDSARAPHIYAFAFPPQTSALSVHIPQEITTIDLTRFCPPAFFRPHFQVGFLAGEYPAVTSYRVRRDHRQTVDDYNVASRLVAKFKLHHPSGSHRTYPALPQSILLPDDDPFLPTAAKVRTAIDNSVQVLRSDLG